MSFHAALSVEDEAEIMKRNGNETPAEGLRLIGPEISKPCVTQPFKCGDIDSISGASVVCPMSVPEPRGLDKAMGNGIIFGIVDLGGCWVSFEDLESGKDNSTR